MSLGILSAASLAYAAPTSRPKHRESHPQKETKPQKKHQIEDALAHFKRANELYEEQDYAKALLEYRRAYELAPNFRILLNIAGSYSALKDYAQSVIYLERFLEEGGKRIDVGRRERVTKELKKLKERTARLEIRIEPLKAQVSINGEEISEEDRKTSILVNIGRHHVVVEKEGYKTVETHVDVVGGDVRLMEITLPKGKGKIAKTRVAEYTKKKNLEQAPERSPSEPKLKEDNHTSHTGLWVSASLTALLGIATLTTGILAIQAESDLEDRKAVVPASREEIADQQDQTKRLSLATDILLGVTCAAAVSTLFFTIDALSEDDEDAENGSGTNLKVGVQGASLQLRGQF